MPCRTHRIVVVALAACMLACSDDVGPGESTGAASGMTGDETSGAPHDPPVEGVCARPCSVESDCGDPQDWTCDSVGLGGYCEHIGEERPCDLCSEEDGVICTPVLGLRACVLPCETDEVCPSPATCTGTTDEGRAFCSTTGSNEGAPAHPNAPSCTIWSICTCAGDDDCPVPGTTCAPNEG